MKTKEIRNMNKKARNKKLKELKTELVKARKSGSNVKNIRKTIAQIHTINKSEVKNPSKEGNKEELKK
ncbi:MAG TPA: 50S ribosomal protein L29 [Candidatus Nanoarchaeia archaeon]|nr:50S ribosomal protein L29 [Candidatus Nanoarchaeia archaeon]